MRIHLDDMTTILSRTVEAGVVQIFRKCCNECRVNLKDIWLDLMNILEREKSKQTKAQLGSLFRKKPKIKKHTKHLRMSKRELIEY